MVGSAKARSKALLATALSLGLLPWQSLGAASLTCESDGYYRRCQADTKAGVQLSRELGGVRCIQSDSWGYDDAGIWVDRGCRAEFTLGAVATIPEPATPPRAMPPGPAPQQEQGQETARSDEGGTSPAPTGGGGIDTTTAVLGAVGIAAAIGAAAALLGGGDDDNDKDKDERKKKIARAKDACRDQANRDGYRSIEVTDTEKDGRDVQIDLKMKQNGRLVTATCDYDIKSKRARIYASSR